ncbi:hypothetical protein HOE49_05100 [Candidatus Peregrinibacteria bacterium]|jgi:hypothetical protein|nr:hypothetical protein [Candidatus Peregrinibacteria bacterium]MBT4366238.1 hypothetical protein [Candidatus Peregrinibacteria bacterium]
MQENKLPEDADAQEDSVPGTDKTDKKTGSKSWKKAIVAFVVLAILGVVFYTTDLNRFFKGIIVDPIGDEDQQEPLADCDDEGLVSYWPMDEGFGNTLNDVVGENDGTIYGEYEWVENADGSVALRINDGYIDFGNDESLNAGMEDLSLVARLKTVDQNSIVFGKAVPENSGNPYTGYFYSMRPYSIVDKEDGSQGSPGTSLFWFKDGGYPFVEGNESYACPLDPKPEEYQGYTCGYGGQYTYIDDAKARVNDGNWHIVTGTLNREEGGGGTMNSYADGLKTSVPERLEPIDTIDNEGEFRIGAPQVPTYNYEGLISDLAVYKKEISQEDVEEIHSLPKTSKFCSYEGMYKPTLDIEAGLVSHQSFDELKPGNVIVDEVEGLPFGSIKDSDLANEDGDTPPELVEGFIGNAFQFDGLDDVASVGNNPVEDGSLTLSTWIKIDGEQLGKFSMIMSTSSTKYYLAYNTNNAIRLRTGYMLEEDDEGYDSEKTNYKFCDIKSGTNLIIPGEWTHVAATLNHANGEHGLYVNGENVKEKNEYEFPKCQTIGGSAALTIGGSSTSYPFDGAIDESRVYNRALTDAEIKGLYDYEVAISEGIEPQPLNPEPVTCEYNETEYEVGETYDADDDCNTCTCGEDGQISCTADSCEPEQQEVTTYHWNFNEGEGATAHDSGGTQNDGMLFGDQGWVDGTIDGAFNFTNGHFRLEEPITINADQPFTISAWVKLDEIESTQYIMSSETSVGFENGNWIAPILWNNNKQIFGASFMDGGLGGGTDKPAYHKYTYSGTSLEPDNWYNLVATYDGQDNVNSIKLYVNGIEELSYSLKSWQEGWTAISSKTTIGVRAGDLSSNKLLGSIDDLKMILGEAMDWAQVKEEYDAIMNPPEPDPVTCTNDEAEYEVGETFDAGDDCNTCACGEDGQISCTADSCEPESITCTNDEAEYEVGETFDAGDDCNTCACEGDGQILCTEEVCEPEPEPDPITCEYNSENYAVGETFDATDDCNICVCESDGGITCTNVTCDSEPDPVTDPDPVTTDPDPDPVEAGGITINPNPDPINCLYESKTYSPGAAIFVDDCNTCFCGNNGQMSCTHKTCDEADETDETPAPTPTPGPVASTPLPTTSPYCISGTDKTTFVDLEEGEIKASAEYLSQLTVDDIKVVGGYDTAFGHEYRPNNTITRAEFAKILLYLTRCDDVRQCNSDYSQGPLPSIQVEDVDTASWYYNVVRCGLKEDIFYPDTNDEFRPEVPITRAEATEMIVRAANIDASDEDGSTEFTDIQEDSYFNEFIGAASKIKIINGYSDSTFRPDNPISRGEAALILTRYLYQKSLTE